MGKYRFNDKPGAKLQIVLTKLGIYIAAKFVLVYLVNCIAGTIRNKLFTGDVLSTELRPMGVDKNIVYASINVKTFQCRSWLELTTDSKTWMLDYLMVDETSPLAGLVTLITKLWICDVSDPTFKSRKYIEKSNWP